MQWSILLYLLHFIDHPVPSTNFLRIKIAHSETKLRFVWLWVNSIYLTLCLHRNRIKRTKCGGLTSISSNVKRLQNSLFIIFNINLCASNIYSQLYYWQHLLSVFGWLYSLSSMQHNHVYVISTTYVLPSIRQDYWFKIICNLLFDVWPWSCHKVVHISCFNLTDLKIYNMLC